MPATHIELSIDLRGDESVEEAYGKLRKGMLGKYTFEAMERVVEYAYGRVVEHAPQDLGELIANIDSDVEVEGARGELVGSVWSTLEYAPPQERGTEPYWPNIENLEAWAERHGTTAYVVARAIARRGLLPQWYYLSALVDLAAVPEHLVGPFLDAVGKLIEYAWEE